MADSAPTEGIWCHIEIPSSDVQRCKSFYGEVFGWQFQEIPEMDDYVMYTTREGGIGGGISTRGDQTPPHMLNYVLVSDIETTVERVRNNGGNVLMEKTEVPNAGWFAIIQDPENNIFGIWKSQSES